MTCSQCLQSTMAVFEPVAANKSQPIGTDYTQAAQMINMGCGPDFVNQTVAQSQSEGAAAAAFRGQSRMVMGLLIGIVAFAQVV